MNISQQLDEIIKLLSESGTSNYIAIVSVVVAILALLANIITNRKNHKQYIESLKPLLTFDFYEINGELLLSVTNRGKTEAKNIRLEILQMRNNGNNNNLILDGLFENKFMLFPEEEVQGTIGHYGGNVENKCFPVVDVKISYLVSAKYSCGFPDPQALPIIVVDRYLDYFTTIMEDRLWQILAKPVFRWRNRFGLSMNAARAA